MVVIAFGESYFKEIFYSLIIIEWFVNGRISDKVGVKKLRLRGLPQAELINESI